MKVKPAIPGAVIRDPRSKNPLPADGAEVPDEGPDASFWIRRLKDGDVVRVEAPVPTGMEPITPLTTRGGK